MSPIKTHRKGKMLGLGLMHTAKARKKTVKMKNQSKTKKKEVKGLKKNSAKRNPRAPVKTVYLPSDINSLHKRCWKSCKKYYSKTSF